MRTQKIDSVTLRQIIIKNKGIENVPIDVLELVNSKGDFLKTLTDDEMQKISDIGVDYWYKRGFPYDNYTDDAVWDAFKKLQKLDVKHLMDEKKEIEQNLAGLGAINSFHPHRWEVQCRTFKTPMEVFKNRELFKKVIIKCIKLEGQPFNITSLRGTLRIYSGVHLASNFKPTVVKYMYNEWAPMGAKVLDPSMGFGGRMFGALASNISEYHCCDPLKETVDCNKKILKLITEKTKQNSNLSVFMDDDEEDLPKIVINNIPFENYDYEENYFDLVFTSPPYFGIEKYQGGSHKDEEGQSWKNYPEYENWLNKFYKRLFEISHKVLKKGGYIAINIAGKVKKHDLEKDTVRIGNEVFGDIHDVIFMKLGKMIGTKGSIQKNYSIEMTGHKTSGKLKLDPIFIWQKK